MSNDAALPVYDYLQEMGDLLDCYFVVEQLASTLAYDSPLESGEIVPAEIDTIDALVAKLNDDIEGITATRDGQEPSIIHVVEDALKGVSNYALNQSVTIDMRGSPNDLVRQLGAQLSNQIAPGTRGSIPLGALDLLYDDVTQISVNVTNEVVRNVLTHAVPLDGYSRIIWGARTYVQTNGHLVELGFAGPAEND